MYFLPCDAVAQHCEWWTSWFKVLTVGFSALFFLNKLFLGKYATSHMWLN